MREFHKKCKRQKVQNIIDAIKERVEKGQVSCDILVNLRMKISTEQEGILKEMGYRIRRVQNEDLIEVFFDTPNL